MPISLSLPLREEAHQGGPVIAYLENLLPDNQAIRQRVPSSFVMQLRAACGFWSW
ncbi:HipA N-terminal domain-containing protein [Pseudophaeobacter leonis]|uniref:HipA N-terminal domain-containing protein n=1 Tax=Pseudophaeobacter leonis TaxID=1144477 RepID=UPI001F4E16B4|nr:HipA N-terminal domain-containing protein [Pseudophaeobacter leonis]